MRFPKLAQFAKKAFYSVLVFVAAVSVITVTETSLTHAATKCDTTFYSTNDILYYNPCTACSTDTSQLLGGTNEEKIFKWFISKGFNAAQASGVLGNMQSESSFNPFRMEGKYSTEGLSSVLPIAQHPERNKAFGLAQWDGGRRQQVLSQLSAKYPDFEKTIDAYGVGADDYQKAPPDVNDNYLSFELEYLYQELNASYKGVVTSLQAVPNTEDGAGQAAAIWNSDYEVSSDSNGTRANNAKAIFAKLKDSVDQSAGIVNGSQTSPSTDSTVTPNSSVCSNQSTSGSVVWYSQTDPRWKDIGYAGDTIGLSGCGPSSMAIILASLVDKNITPPDVAAVAGAQSGGTSSHANLIAGVNAKWGLNISTQSLTMSQAIDFVKSGQGYVWMGGQGAPPFTQGGHMVAMVGVTNDGQITIADPYGDGPGHQHIADYPAAQIEAESSARYGVAKR